MSWTICFFVSVAIVIAAVITAIDLAVKKRERGMVVTPLNVLVLGLFLALVTGFLPVYAHLAGDTPLKPLKVLMYSIHNTLQAFTIDTDCGIIIEQINSTATGLSDVYAAYMAFGFIAAPFLMAGFVVSFLKNISAYLAYVTRFFSDVYIFSKLNEQSLALGSDIKQNHRNATVIFTDAFDEAVEDELPDKARKTGAILFKKDVLSVDFKLHARRARVSFFMIGEDEQTNVEQALDILEAYGPRENTHLFVFSSHTQGELLLTGAAKGHVKVRRVNTVRSLIDRTLYEDGVKIFDSALPAGDGMKEISAVVVGMGQYGTEMVKALSWYCQMDGYRLRIDAYDRDILAGEKFAARCPELMSEKYNGVTVPGEAAYSIQVHSGIDVWTKSFADRIMERDRATYVLVALGVDGENIRAAVELRMLFERNGAKPVIDAIVFSADMKKALAGVKNFKGQPYDIGFIGDVESSYSERAIIKSELEERALRHHLQWGGEDEFWQYEYNYRSSVATSIHSQARSACRIPGADKKAEDWTEREKDAISMLEHKRWNAYMRSEGYVYSGSPDKASRNDLGKTHHDLVAYEALSEEDKEKDCRVAGT